MTTVIWLVWIFGSQTSNLSVFILMLSFLCLGMGCWIYGRWGNKLYITARIITTIWIIIGIIGIVVATKKINTDVSWENFDFSRIENLHKQKIPIFIDFTAKWCVICQSNEIILELPSIKKKFTDNQIIKMKADWTLQNPLITSALKKFGKLGVPLYVLYDNKGSDPLILPQILTPEILAKYLDQSVH